MVIQLIVLMVPTILVTRILIAITTIRSTAITILTTKTVMIIMRELKYIENHDIPSSAVHYASPACAVFLGQKGLDALVVMRSLLGVGVVRNLRVQVMVVVQEA